MDVDILESCFLTAVLDNLPDLSESLSPVLDKPFVSPLHSFGLPVPATLPANAFADSSSIMPDDYSSPYLTTTAGMAPAASYRPLMITPEDGRQSQSPSSSDSHLTKRSAVAGAVGTTRSKPVLPPCRVCNGTASGFHYGVNTCKACKGFFHRCLRRKSTFECGKEGSCNISEEGGKSSCPACRYKRCIAVGMTKEAAKIGRYTHWKRTQDTLEIKRLKSFAATVCPRSEAGAHTSTSLATCVTSAFVQSFNEIAIFHTDPGRIEAMKNELLLWYHRDTVDHIMLGDAEDRLVQSRYMASIPAAVTNNEQLTSEQKAAIASNHTTRLHFMVKTWAEKMDLFVRAVVSFAKSIPGFKSLPMQDQIALVKEARAEIQCLLFYRRYDARLKCIINYNAAKNALVMLPVDLLRSLCHDDDFFDVVSNNLCRLDGCALSLTHVALLTAIVIASPDREHLSAKEQVEAMQDMLVTALKSSVDAGIPGKEPAALASKAFASALLVLPVLRTCGHRQSHHIEQWRKTYPIELSPLVQECLIKPEAPPAKDDQTEG